MAILAKGTIIEVISGVDPSIGSTGIVAIDEGEQEGDVRDVLCLIDGDISTICIKTDRIKIV